MRIVPFVLAVVLFLVSGCSLLTSSGLFSPSDLSTACATVVAVCADAKTATDPQVKQACTILTAACATQLPPTSTTSTTLVGSTAAAFTA